jgi:acetolactate synthase-1/2/3 large subunit
VKEKLYKVLVEQFKHWGITHVFGIPGKPISPLMLGVEDREIQYVLSRHESGAGFEAAGYALAKNTLGIAIGTSGPGGTNLITAAAQVKECNIPVLFITGHPSMSHTGRAQGQDSSRFGTDLLQMFESVTLFNARVERGDLLKTYVQHAVERAFAGAKGPVHLSIPFDVLVEDIEPFVVPLPRITPTVTSNIDRVISLLNEAKKPVLLLGKGVVSTETYEEVRVIAEHWKLPVITVPGGKGSFPNQHPLYIGGFGLGGKDEAPEFLSSGVDLMVVIGSKLCDMSLSGFTTEMYPEQVIHFDYEVGFAGKSIPVPTELVLGDTKANLHLLIEKADARLADFEMRKSEAYVLQEVENKPLSAHRVMKTLRYSLPEDTIIFGDAGSHSLYAVRDFNVIKPGTFYFDEVYLAMGYAIGMAIGAQMAAPEKRIVCFTGDGCFLMHGTEISTAVNQQVPVIFFVLNNGRLDMVDKGMSYNTGRSIGAIYESPINITLFAQSLGAKATRCFTEQEIIDAVEIAFKANGPTVIELMVDPNEMPPILTRLLSLDE